MKEPMNLKSTTLLFSAIIAVVPYQATAQTISYYQTGEEFAGPFPSWKSVKEFGAKGDGLTDDAAAIGKALKALKNTNTRTWNVLYFPAGTYMIGQPVYYTDRVNEDYTGIRIVGEDPATTLIKCMDDLSRDNRRRRSRSDGPSRWNLREHLPHLL